MKTTLSVFRVSTQAFLAVSYIAQTAAAIQLSIRPVARIPMFRFEMGNSSLSNLGGLVQHPTLPPAQAASKVLLEISPGQPAPQPLLETSSLEISVRPSSPNGPTVEAGPDLFRSQRLSQGTRDFLEQGMADSMALRENPADYAADTQLAGRLFEQNHNRVSSALSQFQVTGSLTGKRRAFYNRKDFPHLAHPKDHREYVQNAWSQLRRPGNILLLGDIHLTGQKGDEAERNFQALLEFFGGLPPGAIRRVMHLGDNTDSSMHKQGGDRYIMRSVQALQALARVLGLSREMAENPISFVAGNHDLMRVKGGFVNAPPDPNTGRIGTSVRIGANGRNPLTKEVLYDNIERDNLVQALAAWSQVLTRHPDEITYLNLPEAPGVVLRLSHEPKMVRGPNIGRVLSEKFEEVSVDEDLLPNKVILNLAGDRHNVYLIVGNQWKDPNKPLITASPGTFSPQRPKDVPATFMTFNPNDDQRVYVWAILADGSVVPYLLTEGKYRKSQPSADFLNPS